jgi:hypothetical protein
MLAAAAAFKCPIDNPLTAIVTALQRRSPGRSGQDGTKVATVASPDGMATAYSGRRSASSCPADHPRAGDGRLLPPGRCTISVR